ncbi:hypothetical protein pEaSNUABM8_00148 [Erwinia phage pEa_SNUABM_8]|nr:hypothetical protein pEaSNUABM8_00148 [Erwinia phage pEa_SNUABM_8]QVW54900.1 hypothetical protein pEaSNUABM4_00147 [Erwinia phage pEa_SNUABM_4]
MTIDHTTKVKLVFPATDQDFYSTVCAVQARLREQGFINTEIVERPFGFFRHANLDDTVRNRMIEQYRLTLAGCLDLHVTEPETCKHIAMINVWHDVFTHVIPTGTSIVFSPTLAMLNVAALRNVYNTFN